MAPLHWCRNFDFWADHVRRIALEFTGNALAHDESNKCIEAVMPEEIDGDAENLADHAGIRPDQAELALEWMRLRDQEEVRRVAGDVVARLLAEIIPEDGRVNAQICGLRFAATSFLLNKSGESLTALAQRLGVSKQLLDYHALYVGDRLGFRGFSQKATSTRATYAEAQRQAWSRLSPQERKKRRAGKSAQSTMRGEQFDTETMVSCKNSPHSQNSAGRQESLPIGSPAP